MPGQASASDQVLTLARTQGVLRVRDLIAHGLHPEVLRRLHQKRSLIRVGRGMYRLPDAPVTENHTLAEVCKRVPAGVVCLLSALQFHGLTSQSPFVVWLTIDRKAWPPKEGSLPVRIVRASGRALTYGVEEHRLEEVPVKVYSAAKTVADCFKYRNKLGLDVALEALRDCRRKRKASADDLWRAATVCRVANVMRPYMEAMT